MSDLGRDPGYDVPLPSVDSRCLQMRLCRIREFSRYRRDPFMALHRQSIVDILSLLLLHLTPPILTEYSSLRMVFWAPNPYYPADYHACLVPPCSGVPPGLAPSTRTTL